nr:hypothetical protein [Agromyces humi]
MDDLPVAESEDEVPARHEFEVTPPILVERGAGVERSTVDLDDEPVADQNVHAADPVDGNLQPVPDPPRPQEQANSSFDPRLGIGIRSVEHDASRRRHPGPDEVEVLQRQVPRFQR